MLSAKGTSLTLLPVLSGVSQGSISIVLSNLFLSIHPSVHHTNPLSFVDNTKLFKCIFELLDSLKLQDDLNYLSIWSHDYLSFSTNKFMHFPLTQRLPLLFDSLILFTNTHRELGII